MFHYRNRPVNGALPNDDYEKMSLIAYIGDMSAELASLARRSESPLLGHFFDLARLEAATRLDELAKDSRWIKAG